MNLDFAPDEVLMVLCLMRAMAEDGTATRIPCCGVFLDTEDAYHRIVDGGLARFGKFYSTGNRTPLFVLAAIDKAIAALAWIDAPPEAAP